MSLKFVGMSMNRRLPRTHTSLSQKKNDRQNANDSKRRDKCRNRTHTHTYKNPKTKQSSKCIEHLTNSSKKKRKKNKLRTTEKENETQKKHKNQFNGQMSTDLTKISNIISLNCSLQNVNDFKNHWHESSHILAIFVNDAPTSKKYTEICRSWPDSYVCTASLSVCLCVFFVASNVNMSVDWTVYDKFEIKRQKLNVCLAFSVYSIESNMHIHYF